MLNTWEYQTPSPPNVCALIRWDFTAKYTALGTFDASRYHPTELGSDVAPLTSAVSLKFSAMIGQAGVKYSRSPTLLGVGFTGSSWRACPGEPCLSPKPSGPGGAAYDRPEKKQKKRNGIIRILHLLPGRQMFICIGLVHGVMSP